jgi:hypothetical protein
MLTSISTDSLHLPHLLKKARAKLLSDQKQSESINKIVHQISKSRKNSQKVSSSMDEFYPPDELCELSC